MILTDEILNKGKSSNNGWNLLQLECFGCVPLRKGWRERIIGKDFPESKINKFLELKDVHFKKALKNNEYIPRDVEKKINGFVVYNQQQLVNILYEYEKDRQMYLHNFPTQQEALEYWVNEKFEYL